MPVERRPRPVPALPRDGTPAEPADRHARRVGVLGSIERPVRIVAVSRGAGQRIAVARLLAVSVLAVGGARVIEVALTLRLVAA